MIIKNYIQNEININNDHAVLTYGIQSNNINMCTKDLFGTDPDSINFSLPFGAEDVSENVVKLTTAH
jgi:hypothetical protein